RSSDLARNCNCAHEIGHNYGLQHCNLWQVHDSNPVSDSGSSTEYGDPFGVMGSNPTTDIKSHFDMWEKSILHWIPDASVTTISAPGTYRVYRFDHNQANLANPLALKIVRNSTQDYWIGLRQLFTSNASLMNGAYVLWGYNSVVQGNLLDMATPGTNPLDAALATGTTFHDTKAGITLHPVAKGGTTPNEYLDVQVDFTPRIQWQALVYDVDEQLGTATLTLTRSANTTGAVSVNYATADGTATAGTNYTTQSGTISWANGDGAAKTITISTVSTTFFPGVKTFTVNLSNVTGAVVVNSSIATVNIASAGTTDPSFAADFIDSAVVQALVQPDGKVLVGGWFDQMQDTSFVQYTRNGFGRLNANGTVDATFGNGAGTDNTPVYAMALQPDGKVLIGGNFAKVHGVARHGVARLNSDGSLDATFDPGAGSSVEVRALALQPDGKVIVGGDFTTFAGATHRYIARLNANGTLDASFGSPTFASGSWEADSFALQPDGKILVGGVFYFSSSPFGDNKSHSGIIRVTSTGGVDTTFNTGDGAFGAGNFLERVLSIAVQPNGSVVIGGDFTLFNGAIHNHVARLAPGGAVDGTFNPNANDSVNAVLVQADGKVLVGGSFDHLNGAIRNSFGRLNPLGTLDTVFGAGSGSNASVDGFVMQANGEVILYGGPATIQGVGDQASIALARLFTGLPGLPGTVQFGAPSYSGGEGSAVTVTATRVGGSYGPVSMNYATIPGSAAASRYTPVAGTLAWADGNADAKIIPVALLNDGITQPDQNFSLNLGIPIGGVIAGVPGTTTVTIGTGVNPYVAWQTSKFSVADLLDPSISGDLADPDHDGLPNLLEYAFGFDPKGFNVMTYQSVYVQNIGGTNYLTFAIRRSLSDTDLTYTPQSGPSIGTWSGVPVQVGTAFSNGDGTETVTFRDTVPTSTVARRFMRLQVTRAP
ncbi:MAG: Na-Ca exchanger/integrin-beta4, partial [Verrucomicrobiaceae bacterium]|nr:Na-Ca exchanger/integrin-beta4 [Verrucomicrobiaceae bacterium]